MTARGGAPPAVACPACGAPASPPCYAPPPVPVNNTLLLPDRAAALAVPRGTLALAACPACGLVANLAFDPALPAYGAGYEESQGHSPRFREYADALAARLVDAHGMRDRIVLEIGCGKGEFLAALVAAGAAGGLGVDPAWVPGRLDARADGAALGFIPANFRPPHAASPVGAVVCRHTLEHIGPVRDFLRTLRGALGERTDIPVCFEVPDSARILREGAFYDTYYEHAAYFQAGSLARLFRACGFDPVALTREYDDQYLVLVAYPGAGDGAPLPLEESPAAAVALAADFAATTAGALAAWRARLDAWAGAGRAVAVWGGGSKTTAWLAALGAAPAIATVVDLNPHKHGRWLPGLDRRVKAPSALVVTRPDVVILMNPIYRAEIARDLAAMGLAPALVDV